jgi:hypothetical protein
MGRRVGCQVSTRTPGAVGLTTTLRGAGIAVMLLVIAYLAGRRGGTKAPASSAVVAEQVIPSSFDLIKELNAHAGRLATLLTIVVVVTSFSLANGPIHDALVAFDPSAHGFLYGALVLLAFCVFGGVVAVLGAMNPALPLSPDDEQQWRDLIARKRSQNAEAAIDISGSLLSLLWAWIVVYTKIDYQIPVGVLAVPVIPAIGLWFLGNNEQLGRWHGRPPSPAKQRPWWRFWRPTRP